MYCNITSCNANSFVFNKYFTSTGVGFDMYPKEPSGAYCDYAAAFKGM